MRLENDVALLKNEYESKQLKERCVYFDRGQYFDAYEYISNLINQAKHSITIVDPYFDDDTLFYLKKIKKGVNKRICFSRSDLLTKEARDIFKREYGPVNFYLGKNIHDRFIIVDGEKCYSIGTSLHHMGAKTFVVNRIESKEIIGLILSKVKKSKLL